MSALPDERPPRLGRRLLLRGGLAMLLITLLSAASVATAVLLEVKQDADIFQREQIPIPKEARAYLQATGLPRRVAQSLHFGPPLTQVDEAPFPAWTLGFDYEIPIAIDEAGRVFAVPSRRFGAGTRSLRCRGISLTIRRWLVGGSYGILAAAELAKRPAR